MKFSIVTPCYNMEKYLEETIKSVVYQKGDFEIEYIIIDGGSTDHSLSIIKKYAEMVKMDSKLNCRNVTLLYVSEKDNGMYDAINKGFKIATGDIFSWINSDDKYLQNAFSVISNTFSTYSSIKWIKGKTVFVNEDNQSNSISPCYIFNQKWMQRGIYGRYAYFVNQDSVFWRKDLWLKAGPIAKNLKLAGDYDLWIKFATHEELWSINYEVSSFMSRDGQLSKKHEKEYRREQQEIKPPKGLFEQIIKVFFWTKSKFGNKFERLFQKIYPILFWNTKKEYIEIKNDKPEIQKCYSYRIHN